MTVTELSRVCAQAIVDHIEHQPAPGQPGYFRPVDIAASLIEGALNRALDDQARAVAGVVATHMARLGERDARVAARGWS